MAGRRSDGGGTFADGLMFAAAGGGLAFDAGVAGGAGEFGGEV